MTATIIRAIDNGLAKRAVAQKYATASKSGVDIDWLAVNRRIIEEWGMAGLLEVKELAHSGRCWGELD